MSGIVVQVALAAVMQVGQPAPQETPGIPVIPQAYQQYGFGGQAETRHPYDTQQNWVHGYFQEIPAYRGHALFRPYNYKHVLSQSQTAGGWGMNPNLAYSQQFWHRYQDQATMLKMSQTGPQGLPSTGSFPGYVASPMPPVDGSLYPVSYAPEYSPQAGYTPAVPYQYQAAPVMQMAPAPGGYPVMGSQPPAGAPVTYYELQEHLGSPVVPAGSYAPASSIPFSSGPIPVNNGPMLPLPPSSR
ncbi:hypothetical protein [Planctopirus hydrillae]|uniref:Uncharacterized protein n=1 Tax=Planctopirus hydrillae TaxID=1841610 RepID=A0A1C3E3Q0_9PLAN|nr:hypothetical protein [Planctopirus hydrillae]ODA27878.1 hypothetical protein A6X21_15120 [Planctopirus hydrillae]